MTSKLEQYNLIRTLGKGSYSKVKLALNTEDNKYYAIKIHRADSSQELLDVIRTEVHAVTSLNHPNIISIFEFKESAIVERKEGKPYAVKCVIVDELADGGELFFYVKNTGHFMEDYARYFFK